MELSRGEAINLLNRIVEIELAGAVRYTQYSLMVFGHARIPIMGWMREQAQQSLTHAIQAGEEVTALGGNVSLNLGEMLLQEHHGVELYRRLLVLAEGRSISLEELARQMIRNEEVDIAEIEKM